MGFIVVVTLPILDIAYTVANMQVCSSLPAHSQALAGSIFSVATRVRPPSASLQRRADLKSLSSSGLLLVLLSRPPSRTRSPPNSARRIPSTKSVILRCSWLDLELLDGRVVGPSPLRSLSLLSVCAAWAWSASSRTFRTAHSRELVMSKRLQTLAVLLPTVPPKTDR